MSDTASTAAPASPAEADRARRQRTDRLSGLVLAVLMVAAFALVVRTIVTVASGPLPPSSGSVASPFQARSPTGSTVALADQAGKVVLVDFWATWCPPCVASMPTLEALHRAYADQGFVVLGVNQDEGDAELVRGFAKDRGLTFPIAMDDGHIAQHWGVYAFPTSFLVGRDGVIRAVHRGPASEGSLRREIEPLLAEARPPSDRARGTPTTPATPATETPGAAQ